MRHHRWQLSLAVAASALLTALVSLSGSAQQAPAPTPTARTRPAAEVLALLGRSAGVVILADASVQGRLLVSAATATPETVEQQLAALVRALPAGTTWAKLYVPAPANGRWDVEVVADYARAQARLVGTIGRPAPAGTVEVLGRQVPTEKANEAITTLNLKLVYLVTNPRAPGGPNAAANWGRLTPEQRQAYAQQQAQRLLALDPASRLEALRQLMIREISPTPQDMVLKMVIEQMPEGERVQLKQSVAADDEARGRGK